MTDNIFFTSDTHFNHKAIIRYCNRPWNSGTNELGEIIVTDEDVEKMNEELISNWNSIVPKDGIVYHLGDFALGDKSKIANIVSRLNGKINLVLGNHDTKPVSFYYDAGFNKVYDKKIIINDFCILTHIPMEFLNSNCPFIQIFGHVHDSASYATWSKTSVCVCVERHDYKPVSWKEIKEKVIDLRKEDE